MTDLAGRYGLVRELGRGGMATVWLAEDRRHGRQVAVKILHPELAAALGPARFAREIAIAAALNHPHILPLFDSGEAEGRLFYVMPLVDGGSLRDRLEREGRLPLPDAIRILGQIAAALDHAHRRGLVHRDIKPDNILLAGDQAMLTDFGIARAVEAAGGETLTATGMAIGTPAYMSPEQAFGLPVVDHRSDVYALGCVLFEMVAGRLPFEAPTPLGLLAQHAVDAVPALRTVVADAPLFLERAVAKAMAKEPEQRFATAGELAATVRDGTVVESVGRFRVAVLPPVSAAAGDRDHLLLGLHEALIGGLAEGDVAVLARTSVIQYQGAAGSARDICRALGVDAVVESSLLAADDTLTVQARLIDGRTEEGRWARTFDGTARDALGVFRAAAAALAAEVHGSLRPAARASRRARAVDPVAHERYMRGRVHQQTFNPQDLERAMRYYEAALELQPDYAPAYAGMALIWGSRIVLGMAPALEAGPRYREAAARAVELDPGLAEAHQARAQVYAWYEFDWERAEASFRRAIELDPNEPQARIFYSHFLAMMRRSEESDEQIARALAIDPWNPFTQVLHGIQLGLTGRYAQALEHLAAAPPNPLASLGLAIPSLHLGRMTDGLRHYTRYFTLLGDTELAEALGDATAGPREAMVRGAEILARRSERTFVKPNNIVHLFSWGGDLDRTLDWLERSYAMRDHEVAYMGSLASPAALRADPRFQAFLRRLGLPADAGT